MNFIAFTQGGHPLDSALSGQHSHALVLLSLFIAVLAALSSFSHAGLMRSATQPWVRRAWHLGGAVAMGLGVWAMHFTAMMAFELPVTVRYRADLTLLSVLPAVAAGAVTLNVVARPAVDWRGIVLGGALMGAGIGAMHYTGMAAMVMPAERLYRPELFGLSIVVAVALATLALWVRPALHARLRAAWQVTVLASFIMGLAIASMHYVAMHATVYLPVAEWLVPHATLMNKQDLGALAVVAAVAIVLGATLAVGLRRQLENTQSALHLTQQRLQQLAQRVPGVMYQLKMWGDGRMTFPYTSPAITEFHGVTPEQVEVDGRLALHAVHPEDIDGMLRSFNRSARDLSPWRHEYRVVGGDGHVRWLFGNAMPARDGDGVLWSGFITEITDRKSNEATIERLAYRDPLTGLHNRSRMQQYLTEFRQALQVGQQRMGALLIVDLDRFKQVNGTQGHRVGDQMLKEVAQRLQRCAVGDARIGRLSSDEFMVLVRRLPSDPEWAWRETNELGHRLLEALQAPYELEGRHYTCGASIGAYLIDDARLREDEVLKRADVAMSHAKRAGGGALRFFDPQLDLQMQRRFALEQALRDAIEGAPGQLSLFLQPQVTHTGQVRGFEALLRWTHPVHGAISPAEFIPIAEQTGLILPLGQWVREQACDLLLSWRMNPRMAHLRLSINVSAREFYQSDFVPQLQQLLARHGLVAPRLMLELTESLVLADLNDAISRMQQLRELGLGFAMDDFGTGYSSLSYLAQLPFDEIKIDQSFVRQAADGQRRRAWAVVEAIVDIAAKFGTETLAEGVETEAQRRLLEASGCLNYQGYLFARPAPVDEMIRWLETQPAHGVGAASDPAATAVP